MMYKAVWKLVMVFSFLFIFSSCNKKKTEESEEFRPTTGRTIMETGELVAVNSKAFVLPRFGYWNEMRIIGL